MKKLLLIGLLLFSFNFQGNAQMTTIFECGKNTPDSIYSSMGRVEFLLGVQGSELFTINPNNDNGIDVNLKIPNADGAMFYIFKGIPQMAFYGYMECYIEYTVSDPICDVSLFSSDNYGFSSVPNISGNLIQATPTSMAVIPYYNNYGDSVFKIQTYIPQIDSAFIQINYVRIDLDLSSYMVFTTGINDLTNDDNFNVLPDNQGIKISTLTSTSYQVNVFNVTGQEVYSGMNYGSSNIPFKHEDGIYIVQIIDDNGKMFSKKVFLN